MTTEKLTANGICRKLGEANSILILTNSDLHQEIEAGNDHIGLNVYKRALDTAIDLIRPCYDSLSNPDPAIANELPSKNPISATELKQILEEIYQKLYSLEAVLLTAHQAFPQTCDYPIGNAVETVRLVAELVCAEGEKLDLLTHRL